MAQYPLLEEWATSARETSERFASLINRAASLGCELSRSDFRIPVRFVLDFRRPASREERRSVMYQLRNILELMELMAEHSPTDAASVRCPALQVREVCFNNTVGQFVNSKMLDCITQLMARGVRVRELPSIQTSDRVRLTKTLQQLMPSRDAPSISTLVVSDSSSKESLVAVLSALTSSRSVYEVLLQCGTSTTGQSSADFWRWIAYAVLSCSTTHNVQHLRLQPRSLWQSDIELMRQVLEAQDPLAAAMQVTRDPALRETYISSSRFYLVALSAIQADQEPDFISVERLVVPALSKVDGGWSVLLPGYGVAYVQDSSGDVVKKIKNVSNASSPMLLKVSSDLVSLQSIDATVALFSLIGDRVHAIGFQRSKLNTEPFGGHADTWLSKILKACSHLEEIEIGDVGVSSLSLFVDTEKPLRVSKLVVAGRVEVTENLNSVGRFLEALSTPSHPLADSLQDLQFHVRLSTSQSKAFFEILRTMIHRNHRLRDISLILATFDEVDDLISDTADDMTNKPGGYAVPFQLASKLALLSAVSHDTGVVNEVLDSGVIANIFDFAAELSPRRFRVIYQ